MKTIFKHYCAHCNARWENKIPKDSPCLQCKSAVIYHAKYDILDVIDSMEKSMDDSKPLIQELPDDKDINDKDNVESTESTESIKSTESTESTESTTDKWWIWER